MKTLIAVLFLLPFQASATFYDLQAYSHYHRERELREDAQRAKCDAAHEAVRQVWNVAVREFGNKYGGGTDLDQNGNFQAGSLNCKLNVDFRALIVCYTSSQLPPITEWVERPLPRVNYACEVEYPQTVKPRSKRR